MRILCIKKSFLSGHYTLYKFCKNISICNKIYFLSKITSFCLFKAMLLLLNKIFLYCFSTCLWAKHINFKKTIGNL